MKAVYFISFIVIFSLIFQMDYSFADCPEETLIEPCTCEMPFPTVKCERILNPNTLRDVFNRSGDAQIWNFVLVNSTLTYLPANAINEKTITNLAIQNSAMTALFDHPLQEDNKIMMILLRDVLIQRAIDWALLSPMKKLKIFKAENTDIKIRSSFSENIPEGLTNLILHNTNTRTIRDDAFAKLTSLYQLEITNSKIKSLQRSMFSTPSALEEIHFSGNEISSLPDDLFSHMPVLKKVDFNGNQIDTFSEVVFGPIINQIVYIRLEGNPLKCDCSIFWYAIKEERPAFGKCASPEDLEDKLLQDLGENDFRNCSSPVE